VSVGTLYQYFAHRDAIVTALQDRELERAGALLERVLARAPSLSNRELARSIVAELLGLYRAAPALHRVLAAHGLSFSPPERVVAFDARSVAVLRAFLGAAGSRVRRDQLEAAAFVAYQSVRATLLAYLMESPAGVDDATMIEELTELVVRYLSNEG